jgi:hypothetical protein
MAPLLSKGQYRGHALNGEHSTAMLAIGTPDMVSERKTMQADIPGHSRSSAHANTACRVPNTRLKLPGQGPAKPAENFPAISDLRCRQADL